MKKNQGPSGPLVFLLLLLECVDFCFFFSDMPGSSRKLRCFHSVSFRDSHVLKFDVCVFAVSELLVKKNIC